MLGLPWCLRPAASASISLFRWMRGVCEAENAVSVLLQFLGTVVIFILVEKTIGVGVNGRTRALASCTSGLRWVAGFPPRVVRMSKVVLLKPRSYR